MNLNAPTKNFWWISVILAIIAVLGHFIMIPFVTVYAFWILLIGFIL